MYGCISYLFDCWVDTVVYLLHPTLAEVVARPPHHFDPCFNICLTKVGSVKCTTSYGQSWMGCRWLPPPSPNSFPHHFVARVEHPFHSVTTSVTRWLDNGFNIWPFRTIKICPNSIRMAKISLNFLPNTKYTLKKRSRTVNFGQFFAESVHTSLRPFHFISERNRSWRLFFSISIAFKKIWTLN